VYDSPCEFINLSIRLLDASRGTHDIFAGGLVKVLFDHSTPFLLAHGGLQIQIEQTRAALEQLGVAVEYLRWWDDAQRGDLIHFFGRPAHYYVEHAHQKGLKIVISELLTELGSRGLLQRRLQKIITQTAKNILPKSFTARMAWDSLRTADACIALTAWEKSLLVNMFDTPENAAHVVPNGVEEAFFEPIHEKRGEWLICTAIITERKRVVETAEAAVLAKVPLWVIGRPYSDKSRYAMRLRALQEENPDLIRYEGPIAERSVLAHAYRRARGFVLLSTMESLSLSALEAAACQCPLLLSDLPWARTSFAEHASYCPVNAGSRRTALVLRQFYEAAPHLPVPPAPLRWAEVAKRIMQVYESVLKAS
jgi:glycosyltransferase involved in cell wall biosynthesis